MRASDWQKEHLQLDGWAVQVRSYLINGQYLAEVEVEVLSLGVTIARATEPSRAGAERSAVERTLARLQKTQRAQSDLMVGG